MEINIKSEDLSYPKIAFEIIIKSIPSIFGLLFEFFVEFINLAYVGHLNDPVTIGGVGLGNMMLALFILSFWVGLNGAIDTLVSQAYGDEEYYLWGSYLNRGRIIQTILFIPQAAFLLYTKEILVLFGQDEEVWDVAQFYIILMLPGMYAFAQYETIRRYLQAMGIFTFWMYIQGITVVFHIVLWYFLTYTFELGVIGISVASTITNFGNLLIVILYITYYDKTVPKESWHFFNKDSFKGYGEYFKFGIPSALIICLEWWSYELLTIYAGMLSVDELAAHVMLFNLSI